MITLVFPGQELDRLRERLWEPELESVAILLCTPVATSQNGDWRLIVREAHIAPPDAYEDRTALSARVSAAFGLPFERRARENHWSIVYCHTHPHQVDVAQFSAVDDDAEIDLSRYASGRSPGVPHCALVFAADAWSARRLGTQESVCVLQVGSFLLSHHKVGVDTNESRFDRQIRAFGTEGQERLRAMRVAIVGLGGTGSLMAQQLSHLGVRDFILIDHDLVELTNLNRTVGAGEQSVGESKVSVAEKMIRMIQPAAHITSIAGDVVDEAVSRNLLQADFIFSCTDSHASRHLINQIAYQFVIPAIDMGVAIDAVAGRGVHFAGHVKALAPGLCCLWCLSSLDAQQVRREMMTAEHRAADPYFSGNAGVPQPSVISLNGTVASLAATMFLSMVTGLDAPARYLVYDGNRQRVAGVQADRIRNCNFCGSDSTFLMGDQAPIPVRHHGTS